MISRTAFYIIFGIAVVWFVGAAIYAYQAAIKDFIQLAKDRKKETFR